jgi:hypothetical protein
MGGANCFISNGFSAPAGFAAEIAQPFKRSPTAIAPAVTTCA